MKDEQERARHALDRLKEVEKQSDAFKKSYRSYVERLGPAILINGLGQALAMELAAANGKKEEERAHAQLYQNLNNLLNDREKDLLQAVIEGDQEFYLTAQVEAIAWLSWHKKFCQAYLPREENAE